MHGLLVVKTTCREVRDGPLIVMGRGQTEIPISLSSLQLYTSCKYIIRCTTLVIRDLP